MTSNNIVQASGGIALDIGSGSSTKAGSSKPLPKGLSERLSKRMQKQREKRTEQTSPRVPGATTRTSSGKRNTNPATGTRRKDGSRAPIRINPVTGKMSAVDEDSRGNEEEMVREGCMLIPKKYLTAATDAGLGSSNGMYSNMSGVRRALNGGSSNQGNSSGKPPRSTRSVARVGSSNVHKLSSSTSSAPRSNIRQVVQGRSRSLGTGKQPTIHESSFGRQKGVVNTFGGAKAVRSSMKRSTQESHSEKRKTGIARIATSGGRSFVQTESSGRPKVTKPKDMSGTRETTTIKLGGQPSTSRREDRERRAAHFAKLLGSK